MSLPTLVKPGTVVKLEEHATDHKGDYRKRDQVVADRLEQARQNMAQLQERLYAEARQSLLIVLQAMDTGGKDGTIKHVMSAVNPQGCRVVSFKVPTPDELSRDFLWRVHKQTPAKGHITVFNRSHYEDVLVVRVRELVPEQVWRKRYGHINDFERLLADGGTRILKLFLHISKDEQKRRLQARLDDPTKHWKFCAGDLEERKLWDRYISAYEDALTLCSTDYAPWHIIPADRKWYRNLVVAELVEQTLRDMDPQWPEPPPELSQWVLD